MITTAVAIVLVLFVAVAGSAASWALSRMLVETIATSDPVRGVDSRLRRP